MRVKSLVTKNAIAVLLGITSIAATATPTTSLQQGLKAYNDHRYEEAIRTFRALASEGNTAAQRRLGTMYAKGEGVAKNQDEAIEWYRKAAERGDGEAAFLLGKQLFEKAFVALGNVPMNKYATMMAMKSKEIAKWYKVAASQGHQEAMYELAENYATGLLSERSPQKAAYWYTEAAEAGHPSAQRALGLAYLAGSGVPQSGSKAAYWFRKSAEQGDDMAAYHLSTLYEQGIGVPKDLKAAARWRTVSRTARR